MLPYLATVIVQGHVVYMYDTTIVLTCFISTMLFSGLCYHDQKSKSYMTEPP